MGKHMRIFMVCLSLMPTSRRALLISCPAESTASLLSGASQWCIPCSSCTCSDLTQQHSYQNVPMSDLTLTAGIQAMKLEELERRLRTDIMQEAIAWQGRVMLHKEVSLETPAARQVDFDQAATPSKRVLLACAYCVRSAIALHSSSLFHQPSNLHDITSIACVMSQAVQAARLLRAPTQCSLTTLLKGGHMS